MKALNEIFRKSKADPRTIVLVEGEDERILEAASMATNDRLAQLIVLGNPARIEQRLEQAAYRWMALKFWIR